MEYKNEKDFFCRTLHNLKIYREQNQNGIKTFEYEITQLINSFFGLIIFVKANDIKGNSVLEDFVTSNSSSTWNYEYDGKQEPHDFFNYLRHIRNAIAHPMYNKNLQIKSNNNEIISITFRDKDKEGNVFISTLTIEKINELIEFISKAFLASNQCKPEGKL